MLPKIILLALTSLNVVRIIEASSLAAMAIDLGSQYTKIGIVKPGIPMDIALNRESRRKTMTMVAINGEERLFGDPATNLASKIPSKGYIYLLELLGKKIDHPAVQLFKHRYPYYTIIPDESRGTVVFKIGDGESAKEYSVEALLAMFLRECKAIAEKYGEQKISDAVITVPAYFNQAERRALVDAVDLAGINLLQLINDNTAAGLNYGMFRRKIFNESATTLLLFDMGASKTTATVFEYQIVKDKQTGSKNPQMTTLGFGFDRTLGGNEISLRVRDHLLSIFKSTVKTKQQPEDNPRAMAKLLKEAERVKQVLSANMETIAQIENVMEDKDFRYKYTRDNLDSLIVDLMTRVAKPVEDALRMAELKPAQIDTVVLMGGSTRVVGVQNALQIALDGAELSKFINTDEAAALGAVYQAAHQTKGFKVAKFNVKDTVLYPIQVDFAKEGSHGSDSIDDAAADKRMIHRTLFSTGNAFPMKKVMTFNKHTHDFEFAVNYGDLKYLKQSQVESFGELNITRVDIIGLKDAYDKVAEDKLAEWKGVKVHFKMDNSGVLLVDSAEALVEHQPSTELQTETTFSSFSKKLGSLFGSSDDNNEEKKMQEHDIDESKPDVSENTESIENGKPIESVKSEQKQTSDEDFKETLKMEEGKTEVNETDKEIKPKINETKVIEKDGKPKQEKITLKLIKRQMDLAEMSAETKKKIRKILDEFDKREQLKAEREAAMNNLEAFIIDMRMKYDEHGELYAFASDEERQKIVDALDNTKTWFEDEATFDTITEEYERRLKELKILTKDSEFRSYQSRDRPQAHEAMNQIFNHTELFLTFMKNDSVTESDRIFTDVEMSTLENMYNATKKWWTEKTEAQAKLKEYVDPAYTLIQVAEKVQLLDREFKYLLNKMKIHKPKTKKNETDTPDKNIEPTDDSAGGENKAEPADDLPSTDSEDSVVIEETTNKEQPTDEPVDGEGNGEIEDQPDRRTDESHDEF